MTFDIILPAIGGVLVGISAILTAIAGFKKKTKTVEAQAETTNATADVIETLVEGQLKIIEMLVSENKRLTGRVGDQNDEIRRLRQKLGQD